MGRDGNYDDGITCMQHSINVGEQRQGPEESVNGFSEVQLSSLSQRYTNLLYSPGAEVKVKKSGAPSFNLGNLM
jgi:hypothetical protein